MTVSLEHAVVVGGFFRNILADVAVLDDLSVLQPKNVDDRGARETRPRTS
jgi:hypothetical protein